MVAAASSAGQRSTASPRLPPTPQPQLKCGLLERLAELTLHQNEEKTATLQALLNSEGLLEDAAERGQQRASLGGEDGGGDGLGGGDSSSDGSV